MPIGYSDEFKAQLVREALAGGVTGVAKASKAHSVGESTIRRWIGQSTGRSMDQIERDRYSETPIVVEEESEPTMPDDEFLHMHPEFTDKKIAELDMWKMFDLIDEMQGVVGASSPGQHEARVHIPADGPVIILPTGDWHLGSYASDHAAFREYLKVVFDTPHCYLVVLGDEVDNFPSTFRSSSAVFGQVIPPKVQHRLLSRILHELVAKGKVLCKTWGNHNEFSDQGTGGTDHDYEKILPYLKTMGRLYLTVGDQEYKIFASHTFPGKSYLHVGHQNKRAVRMLWPEADIVLSGHTHSGPEHEKFLHDGLERVSAMVGTLKTDDTYSRRYYGKSQWSDQAIVLHNKERRIVPFSHISEAVTYRRGVVA